MISPSACSSFILTFESSFRVLARVVNSKGFVFVASLAFGSNCCCRWNTDALGSHYVQITTCEASDMQHTAPFIPFHRTGIFGRVSADQLNQKNEFNQFEASRLVLLFRIDVHHFPYYDFFN